jgi:hypothetical protein
MPARSGESSSATAWGRRYSSEATSAGRTDDLLDLDLLTTSRMTSSGSGLSTGTEWCLWTGRILIAVHASGRQGTAIVPTPVFRAATDG